MISVPDISLCTSLLRHQLDQDNHFFCELANEMQTACYDSMHIIASMDQVRNCNQLTPDGSISYLSTHDPTITRLESFNEHVDLLTGDLWTSKTLPCLLALGTVDIMASLPELGADPEDEGPEGQEQGR